MIPLKQKTKDEKKTPSYLSYIYRRYGYRYMTQYVPSYYIGLTEEQKAVQQAVWNFKEGRFSDEQLEWLVRKIYWRQFNMHQDLVMFMPCTTEETHNKRWGRLAQELEKRVKCEITLDGVGHLGFNLSPKHQRGAAGKGWMSAGADPEIVSMRGIILIDDVLNTGETFKKTADALMNAGASSVFGLFIAKAVKPDLPKKEFRI